MTAVGAAPASGELSAWRVPVVAAGAWAALLGALEVLGVEPWCANDRERWFSPTPGEVAEAVATCLVCPVLAECRAYAMAADERHGVWGGLTEGERRELAGRRR